MRIKFEDRSIYAQIINISTTELASSRTKYFKVQFMSDPEVLQKAIQNKLHFYEIEIETYSYYLRLIRPIVQVINVQPIIGVSFDECRDYTLEIECNDCNVTYLDNTNYYLE